MRRKSTRRKTKDDDAAALAAAAAAAAAKAEAEIEAVEIDVLESKAKERSQRRSGSSNSRKSVVKFAIEGEMENLNISGDEQKSQEKLDTNSSTNVSFHPNETPTTTETGWQKTTVGFREDLNTYL